ncbi:MAG TPA: hypothetical protein VGX25_00045 [Actinophytocola sp.]|uniref:hypothetical protein n=1 Tax=Actinophytocola sp. TaxID=1872138 RepID=UPI002DDCC300|nr:hypothetical protein [Actinophytocola sp.]HEV2777767.1 hypothetical protein [Actinophytocola sp.]
MIDPEVGSAAVARVGPPLWRDLPILIMLVAGLVHFARGAPVDGVIFVSIALGLMVAGLRDRGDPRPRSRRERGVGSGERPAVGWVLLAAVGCVGYGVMVGGWVPASVPVKVAVALPGLAILPLAWRVGSASTAPRPGAGRWVWAAVMVAVCLWELNSFLRQPDPRTASYDHPTLSVVLTPLFEAREVRSALLVGWLAVGLWLAWRLLTPPDRPGKEEA